MKMKLWKQAVFLLTVALAATGSLVHAKSSYQELVTLDAELVKFSEPEIIDDVPVVNQAAIQSRNKELVRFRKRLSTLDTSSWPVSHKIDFLIVWAKLNALAFELDVMKPWARDPLFYLYQVNRTPYTKLPVSAGAKDKLARQLRVVPKILKQAQSNLNEAVAPLADLALFHLEHFDGVGQGQPYRDQPPEGTIGWYQDLCARLSKQHPDLSSDCQVALTAIGAYRDWLKTRIDKMPKSAAIGIEQLNWYLTHVRLVPYSVDEVLLLGKRELHRFRFDYLVDRRKNAALPELELTKSAVQHEQRTRLAEQQIRELIARQQLITMPKETPDTYETDTFWSPRAATYRHFWEQLQFRNALNNHIHASIPGHRWDDFMNERQDNPIRLTHGDTGRAEGWGTYLEEMLVQAGITDDNPRARELFYIALIKRGSRIYAETAMHTGEMSLEEANEYMIDYVPFMEVNLGRYDLEGYLREPGAGSMYIIGKIQIERLISERAHQLGDKFDLGEFHDEFLSKGIIPVSLIRWEMTGYDDEVRPLWEQVTAQPWISNQ